MLVARRVYLYSIRLDNLKNQVGLKQCDFKSPHVLEQWMRVHNETSTMFIYTKSKMYLFWKKMALQTPVTFPKRPTADGFF